jgi:hypothetical protein
MIKKKYHILWLNRSLKRMLKRKARLHKHAKRTGNFKEYRHFQKECKRQFRKAEWDHINNIISEGFENKNSKPFWNYMKSKKQDNIGVAPLKRFGGLANGVRSLFRQPIIPTAHCSDGPLFRQPIAPTAHFSDNPLFRRKWSKVV